MVDDLPGEARVGLYLCHANRLLVDFFGRRHLLLEPVRYVMPYTTLCNLLSILAGRVSSAFSLLEP